MWCYWTWNWEKTVETKEKSQEGLRSLQLVVEYREMWLVVSRGFWFPLSQTQLSESPEIWETISQKIACCHKILKAFQGFHCCTDALILH